MEGIDIDSIDDINDLEAHLYAQVHHEPFNKNNTNRNNCLTTVSKYASKALPLKFYCNDTSLEGVTKSKQEGDNEGLHVVRNPLTVTAQKATTVVRNENRGKKLKITNDKEMTIRSKGFSTSPKRRQDQQSQNGNLIINPFGKISSSLRLNPVALNEKRKKQKTNTINVSNIPPFEERRLLKFQKRKSLQNKRLTEKLKINKVEKKPFNEDIIQVDSTDESDSSDVIILPQTTSPIISIDESDDDNSRNLENAILPQKNRTLNTCSVQTADISEKQLENSRCTSPCSILSANDFIEQRDRTHNLPFPNPNSVADDADLLLLTAEVENLTNADNNSSTKEDGHENIPNTTHRQGRQFPEEFVQLDDQEEEEVNTNNLANALEKPSLINVIDSDHEMVSNVNKNSAQPSKFTRKRKILTKHKDQQKGRMLLQDDSDDNDNEEDDSFPTGKRHTPMSYIVRGPAVDQCIINKISKNLEEKTAASPRHRNRCVESSLSSHNVLTNDEEFITALTNLIQGNDTEAAPVSDSTLNESESRENIPTAREIAESVLSGRNATNATSIAETLLDKETAIPKNIADDLSDVFQAIDQQQKPRQQQPNINNDGDNDNVDVEILADSSNTLIDNDNHLNNAIKNGSPVYNVTYIDRDDFEPGQIGGVGWNEEMTKFYNQSWNGELFQLNRILNKMNPDKNLWKIYSEDRFNKPIRRNLKCTNCCEFGHIRSKCKLPRKPLVCYMCGERGHYEPRCPNTICLRCGNKTQVFVKSCNACAFQNRLTCPICKMRGHSINLCPDKWRRYHSTIEPNIYPNHSIQYNTKKYCCVCGVKGHLGENCRNAIRLMEYPNIVSAVKSYTKSYADLMIKSSTSMLITPTSIGVNLMYKPFEEFQFKLALNTKKNKVYGRFLTAVGMSSLLNSKDTNTIIRNLSQPAPNQVQEVSASGEIDKEISTKNNQDNTLVNESNAQHNDDHNDDVEIVMNNNKSEVIISESIQLNVTDGSDNSPTKICNINIPEEQLIDSDSNYSFSEHFDVSPTSTSTLVHNNKNSSETNIISDSNGKDNGKITDNISFSQALPDFIPLMNSTKHSDYNKQGKGKNDNGNSNNNNNNSNNNNKDEPPPPPPMPSEAKIYLTHIHSKYLLSPEGHDFLNTIADTYNVKARIDVTSVGHVVIINGLHADQDKFYKSLLTKYDEILENESKQQSNCTTNSVPKRVDALVRFLRDNINQLVFNLGNANELYSRLKYLDKIQSKGSIKLADKTSRLLNMILLGQAGLLDGHVYLNNLLDYLKCLLNYQGNGELLAPLKLRNDILENWKMIFTSYRHDNYQQLLQMYNKLLTRDCLPILNANPILLGRKPLNNNISTSLGTNTRKFNNQLNEERNKVANPLNCNKSMRIASTQLNTTRDQRAKINTFNSNHNPNRIVNNPDEISMNASINSNKQLSRNSMATVRNPKVPSSFWSNESMHYLDGCIQKASNQPQLLEKLRCVRNKSSRGQLSYNDYLAVIKLHTALVGNLQK